VFKHTAKEHRLLLKVNPLLKRLKEQQHWYICEVHMMLVAVRAAMLREVVMILVVL